MAKTKKRVLISVIIPSYNEEKVIEKCLKSLQNQTNKNFETIIIDDGSTDRTLDVVNRFKVLVLKQNHKGPGLARNLGASHAHGEILVFVDSDMTFDKNFINELIAPILKSETIGTFSKNEIVANSENNWSICWNINKNLPKERMIHENYPEEAHVFRAILKKEFDRVNGFDTTGEYTDDWSLSRKLEIKSTLASGAIYYHYNPSTLSEVWKQARWIGKNEFISGSLIRRIRSLILYSLPASFIIGTIKMVINSNLNFLIFKLMYDLAIWTSTIKSFFGEAKSK